MNQESITGPFEVDLRVLIQSLGELEPTPYDGWFGLIPSSATAERIIEVGMEYADYPPVPVAKNPEWSESSQVNRSWGYRLHSWRFLQPLLREYEVTGEESWLVASCDIALDWLQFYSSKQVSDDPMVWYDMSLAIRTPILLSLTVLACKNGGLVNEAHLLVRSLLEHVRKLHEPEAFNPNNNHGFYAALAQLHLARFAPVLPDIQRIESEGESRLREIASNQFSEDGVQLEHSPDYHRMLLSSFESGIRDGMITDAEILDRIERASLVLGWMTQPDGRLVQFGDSPATDMSSKSSRTISPETQFIISDGKYGEPPKTEMAVFEKGGYAFVRSPAPERPGERLQSGYLALGAAFHSRAHKHADDLNLVWFDQGGEILVDSGRYGYGELLPKDSELRKRGFYYASPTRQYVEGTIAHNTLMMDGEDQDRRRRKPYGGAIVDWSDAKGVFDITGRVRHLDYTHRRRVIFVPGKSLRLKDSVFSKDSRTRQATLWYNLDGSFEIVQDRDILTFERDGVMLEVTGPGDLVNPVRGQEQPLRGWRSKKDGELEAIWSFGFSFPVDTRASVESVFRLYSCEL